MIVRRVRWVVSRCALISAIYPGPSNCLPQMRFTVHQYMYTFVRSFIHSLSHLSIYVGHWHTIDDGHALLTTKRLHSLCSLFMAQLLRLLVCDKHKVVCQ